MLTIATYNVHRCVGRDWRKKVDRVAEVLRGLDASIIGLQEVECMFGGEPDTHQIKYLAAATDTTAIAGPTMYAPDHDYGNCLLTRHEVLALRRHDISVARGEPRGAIDVDLDIGGGYVLRVIVTHLGLRPGERREQIRRLVEVVGPAGDDRPTVLLGDLNEWLPWGRPLRWLKRRLALGPALATFPSRFPVVALDRICVSRHAARAEYSVHTSALAKEASDHLPLSARIEWNGGGAVRSP